MMTRCLTVPDSPFPTPEVDPGRRLHQKSDRRRPSVRLVQHRGCCRYEADLIRSRARTGMGRFRIVAAFSSGD